MDYGQIIKRSWEIVKKNRFLWWLGILAAFAGGFGNYSFNFSGLNGFSSSGGSSSTTSQSADFPKQLSDFFSSAHFPAIIAFVAITIVFMLVVYFVVLYFSIKAKAGLIISVNKIESERSSIGFRAAMREGKKYFWRLFGLGWLVALAMFILILLVIVPILILVFWHPLAVMISLGLLTLVGFILIITFSFLASIILSFAQLFIVLDDKKVFVALHDSYELIKRNVMDVVIGYAITIGIGFVVALAIILLVIAVLVVGAILGGITYLVGGGVAVAICTTVVILAGIVFFAIVIGFITAFTSTYWTLFYRALRYVDKTREESGVAKGSLVQTSVI